VRGTRSSRSLWQAGLHGHTGHGPAFWQAIYDAETRPGWDMDGPTPLLNELLDMVRTLGLDPGPELAVPGCGFGHDAAELARKGFRVTGVDFTEAALEGARTRYGDLVTWRREDWFEGATTFDALFDDTCFVAMPPEARPAYVAACARRLRPGGLWLGAFFHTVKDPSGPPYPIAPESLRGLAEKDFQILHLAPAEHSHPRRAGREFLLVARRN